jgi:hypothetical protein
MKMNTENWPMIMHSKDATRKILQMLPNLTPEDRQRVASEMAQGCQDWDELEQLTRPVRSEMLRRSREGSAKPQLPQHE